MGATNEDEFILLIEQLEAIEREEAANDEWFECHLEKFKEEE
jgi:hypothetical protein